MRRRETASCAGFAGEAIYDPQVVVRPVPALFAKVSPKTGKRRNLGTFRSRAAAGTHERAVQYFKRLRKAAKKRYKISALTQCVVPTLRGISLASVVVHALHSLPNWCFNSTLARSKRVRCVLGKFLPARLI
jgi:hypothetical protein